MNSLRVSIDTIIRRANFQDILNKYLHNYMDVNCVSICTNIDKNEFVEQAFHHMSCFSYDEVENVHQKLKEDWGKRRDYSKADGNPSVFNLINTFSKDVLVEDNDEPKVDYQHLLRWRMLSHLLGEDLFTTNYFAFKDIRENRDRNFWAWSPVISTNNRRLKNILDKGTAENHFHLKGSAPHFEISWLSVMNVIAGRKAQFDEFEKYGKREGRKYISFESSSDDLYTQCIKAAYIRMYLFKKHRILCEGDKSLLVVSGEENRQGENDVNGNVPNNVGIGREDVMFKDLLGGGIYETRYLLNDLQSEIDVLKRIYSCKFDRFSRVYPDYAIPNNIRPENFNGNVLLAGERQFMYNMFKGICLNKDMAVYSDLFYAYLVIKSQFREELIQVNDNTGFTNFQKYQNRKSVFIEDRDIYNAALINMAVAGSGKNQKIMSLEARIAPKSTVEKMNNTVRELDKNIEATDFTSERGSLDYILEDKDSGQEEPYYFYNAHFIKKKEKLKAGFVEDVFPRNNGVRKTVKQQAQAIAKLRDGLYEKSNRIKAIDAASSEFDARPEAFAQAFRYLRNHTLNNDKRRLMNMKEIPKLGVTYHAGEDFFDIIDGLRAIDESVKFLNLGEGDRIGHALALGIDIRDYYESKKYSLMKPKQVHLDDIVWLLSRITKYGLSEYLDVVTLLKRDYMVLFQEIYGKVMGGRQIEHEIYYESWKLRGDAPELYKDGEFKWNLSYTFWQSCGFNPKYPYKKDTREIVDVAKLYHCYHYNSEVKAKGAEIKRVEISKRCVKVIDKVQKAMQLDISKKHIAIEANPSSNLLIGSFTRYDKHPLVNFFNMGLETDPEKLGRCPQLFVSINTDDQGVFNTYLENEYALMAIAMEKVEDDDGRKVYNPSMIYDWLDRIRQMGLEMSFKEN